MSRRHEQLLFRYSSALERGDFEAVAEVLHDAERDPTLEQMILDLNAAYSAEPSLNHKNPKEVPMIAALYQKHPPAHVRWQSLPLVAALAVIGLLVVMLAVQTRGANISNGGQGSTPLAVAQNSALCQATTLAPVNVVTLPGTAGVILGTIPADQVVTVLERRAYRTVVWYFITTPTFQGWITIESLDTKNCHETASSARANTPTLIPNVAAQPSPYPTALAQSEITCAASTLMKVDLLSVPSLHPNVIGSLPSDTLVRVMDYNVWVNSQKNQILWYYVKSNNLQGWTLSYQLDASSCPPIPDLHIAVISQDIQFQTATSQAALLATATQMIIEATHSAEYPTLTATPAFLEITVMPPTAVPPENDTAGTAQHPFLIAPTFDPMKMTGVVATLNATFQATMIPVHNGDQATACSTPVPGESQHMTLYERPATDAPVVGDFYTVDASQSHISVLQAVNIGVQTWYYIEIGSYPNQPRGYVSKETFDVVTGNCNISYVQPVDLPTFTPTPALVPSLIPSEAGILLDTCQFPLEQTVSLYNSPAADARVIELVHKGTQIQIGKVSDQWLMVTVRYPDNTSTIGFVRADALTLPDDCHLTPPGTTATLVPASVQALPIFTPISANVQVNPAECAFSDTDPGRIQLYARPSLDSGYAYDAFSSLYIPQSELTLLDAVDVGTQAWYFVQIHGKFSEDMRGWMTEEEFNKNVRCAPLVNPGMMTQTAAQVALSATPTPAPLDLTATALSTFTPTPADRQSASQAASAVVTDYFPIYIVQPGDTVLYILSEFGLDANAFPRLRELNFLNKDGDLTPGMALVIPVSLPDEVTSCTFLSGQSIELRAHPLKADPIVYFLPQPTTFIIEGEFKNGDGMWATAKAQVDGMTMDGVWIQVDQMDGAATCSQDSEASTTAIPTVEATPTPIR